ncbi:acyloxyacyl hydrolase [Spirosoma sp. RP8]|uniref:Acyloxyacyl hydrolase n=1 Tax=Spirosoma liriopis TaxID=2937440 RepID=A0ABT0HPD9_9BACT|nr:acyloxyacyl hydrolase [Spirosoma liriopis]MCK8493717.1 acyloxyacyl hydrolase [Spirosoma liriopis]
MVKCILYIALLFPGWVIAQSDSSLVNRQFVIKLHQGLYAPDQVVPSTGNVPQSIELDYSWLGVQRKTWEQCNCFARTGIYANYIAFRNPIALGRTAGAGFFFEPMILYRRRFNLSVRGSIGLTYLTRVYDPETNPTNQYFSLPISSMIGASLNGYYQLTDRVHVNLSAHYNHISNAGTRQPNQGMNIPSLAVGLVYSTNKPTYPNTRLWKHSPLVRRWIAHALLMSSIRVLPGSPESPEMALPMFGLKLLGGYRLSQSHVLSGGVELVDDLYFKEQVKRWRYKDQNYRQGTLLAGYEFWQGRYLFTAHMGWNVVRPRPYKPATYQKYGLLYRFNSGITVGFDVKAYGDDTKGFQFLGGMTF